MKPRKANVTMNAAMLHRIEAYGAEIKHDREKRLFVISIPVLESDGKRLFTEFTRKNHEPIIFCKRV